jgi:hypothetical protein
MVPQISSFFELAALLIPVLLLSGYVTQRLRPTPLWESVLRGTATRDSVVRVGIVALFGLLPIMAEVAALSATMSGGTASAFNTWLVAAAVVIGIVSVAGTIVWPWFRQTWNIMARVPRVVLVFGVTGLLVQGANLLHAGVDNQRWAARRAELTTSGGIVSPETAVSLWDANIAKSEIQERLLRDRLADTRGKARKATKLAIKELLIKRLDAVQARLKAEFDLKEVNAGIMPADLPKP